MVIALSFLGGIITGMILSALIVNWVKHWAEYELLHQMLYESRQWGAESRMRLIDFIDRKMGSNS